MKKTLKAFISILCLQLLYNCSAESEIVKDQAKVVETPTSGVLSASEITKNNVKLSWTPFSINASVKRIVLKRGTTDIFTSTNQAEITKDFFFTDSGLLAYTNYSYQLTGYDALDKVFLTNEISLKTLKNISVLQAVNMPAGVKDETAISWNPTTGVVEILKNVSFSAATTQDGIDADKDGFNWIVPEQVSKIVIKSGVTVTGHFKLGKSVTIEGEDRATSIIFGTAKRKWSLGPNGINDSPNCNTATGDDLAADCQKWQYGGISGNQTGAVYSVKNLTIKNARTYAITSFESKIIMDNVYIVNTRPADDKAGGDYGSNSDGISAGFNSEVRNCKFDTWDDSIKLYKDMTVENVTIVQNSNGAAFQLGWGSKPTTSHTLKNILIVTKNTGYSNLSVFSVSGETANISSTINLGDFAVKIESGQKFRNTTKSLPLFLNKSNGNVSLKINSIGTNYSLVAPAGLGKFNDKGEALTGTYTITGTICDKSIEETAININCGNSTLVTGCGW